MLRCNGKIRQKQITTKEEETLKDIFEKHMHPLFGFLSI
jgi:hypothetical protein